MRVRLQHGGGRSWCIWLPIMLLWALAIVVMALLLPVLLIALMFLWLIGFTKAVIVTTRAMLPVIQAAKGLRVRIHKGDRGIDVEL